MKTQSVLPKQNFLLHFTIDNKPHKAVFIETASGLFDIRYGFDKWVDCQRDSLNGILADFSLHLKKYYHGAVIQLNDPIKISEKEARSYSNITPNRDQTPSQ